MSETERSFWRRRVMDPLRSLLRHGVTPEKLALSLTCGALLGVFPVMGTTIALCMVTALVLRLNQAAIQISNHLVYPLQLAMIVPFIRAGQTILHVERTKMTLRQMLAVVRADHVQAFHLLWKLAVAGIAAWALFAAVVGPVLYWALLRMAERVERQIRLRRALVVEEVQG